MRRAIAIAVLSTLCVEARAEPPTPDAELRRLDALLSAVRARNREDYAVPRGGVDEGLYVTLGGVEQWVTIRGWDRANPVLLFVHGGPGDVTNPWSYALFAPWEKQFTVVQWDQRGAGRSLRKSGPPITATLTIDRLVRDGVELAELLKKRLGKDKIIVVAHSFGTIVALGMVRARPELFYAYVGTGQVGDERKNQAVAYDALVAKARALGNQQAIDELRGGRGGRVQHKWANAFEGADRFLLGTIGLALTTPGGSVQDMNDSADGQGLSADRLVPQTMSRGPKELGLEFAVPMFVFQGEEDFTTPTSLARAYVEAMKAPRKELVTIEAAGHFAVFMKPERFLQELVRRVRPLAK